MSTVHPDPVFPDPSSPESITESIQRLGQFNVEQDARAVTAAYSMDPTDDLVLADATAAAFTVTLPPITNAQRKPYHIKRTNSGLNNVTVDGFGAETIDGAATYVLITQYDAITVLHNGTTWWII